MLVNMLLVRATFRGAFSIEIKYKRKPQRIGQWILVHPTVNGNEVGKVQTEYIVFDTDPCCEIPPVTHCLVHGTAAQPYRQNAL